MIAEGDPVGVDSLASLIPYLGLGGVLLLAAAVCLGWAVRQTFKARAERDAGRDSDFQRITAERDALLGELRSARADGDRWRQERDQARDELAGEKQRALQRHIARSSPPLPTSGGSAP